MHATQKHVVVLHGQQSPSFRHLAQSLPNLSVSSLRGVSQIILDSEKTSVTIKLEDTSRFIITNEAFFFEGEYLTRKAAWSLAAFINAERAPHVVLTTNNHQIDYTLSQALQDFGICCHGNYPEFKKPLPYDKDLQITSAVIDPTLPYRERLCLALGGPTVSNFVSWYMRIRFREACTFYESLQKQTNKTVVDHQREKQWEQRIHELQRSIFLIRKSSFSESDLKSVMAALLANASPYRQLTRIVATQPPKPTSLPLLEWLPKPRTLLLTPNLGNN